MDAIVVAVFQSNTGTNCGFALLIRAIDLEVLSSINESTDILKWSAINFIVEIRGSVVSPDTNLLIVMTGILSDCATSFSVTRCSSKRERIFFAILSILRSFVSILAVI